MWQDQSDIAEVSNLLPLKPWAGNYIGIPHAEHGLTRDGISCWGLLRMVWMEMLGFESPSFSGISNRPAMLEDYSKKFAPVVRGQEREFDAVVMETEYRRRDKWVMAELHVGVIAYKGLVLHVHKGFCSHIEDIRKLRVTRILRPIR